MHKSCVPAARQMISHQRGSLSPPSPSAITNVFTQWAFINFLLFSSPFIIGATLLKLFPCIVHDVSSMNDLAIGLPLIVFYASAYIVFMDMSGLLRFDTISWSRHTAAQLYCPKFFRYHRILLLFIHHKRHRSHWIFTSQRRFQAVCKAERFTIFIMGAARMYIPMG